MVALRSMSPFLASFESIEMGHLDSMMQSIMPTTLGILAGFTEPIEGRFRCKCYGRSFSFFSLKIPCS